MHIIKTNHFISRWKSRVGAHHSTVGKLVNRAIYNGEARVQERKKLGIMVPISIEGEKLFVVGVPGVLSKKEFVLKTVMHRDMARRMGWNVQ